MRLHAIAYMKVLQEPYRRKVKQLEVDSSNPRTASFRLFNFVKEQVLQGNFIIVTKVALGNQEESV